MGEVLKLVNVGIGGVDGEESADRIVPDVLVLWCVASSLVLGEFEGAREGEGELLTSSERTHPM